MVKRDSHTKVERLHPAAYGVMLYILVGVGRLPELFTVLQYLYLGKLAIIISAIGMVMYKGGVKPDTSDSIIFKRTQLFFLLCVLSVPTSIWISYSITYLTGTILFAYLFIWFVIRSAVNSKTFNVYISTLIIAAVILTYKTLTLSMSGRLSVGSSYDPNDLAQVLITILPLVLYRVYTSKFKTQMTYIAILAAMLFAILLTGSRGGLLGLIAVSSYLVVKLSNSAASLFKIVFILVIGVFFVAMMAPQSTVDRYYSMFSLEDDYNTTSEKGRLAIWGRGIDTMIARPIGVGVGAFEAAEGKAGGRYKAAHNAYIQIGVELGWLGITVFFLILWNCFKVLKQIHLDVQGSEVDESIRHYGLLSIILRASFIGFMTTGFFLSSGYASLLYGLIAMTVTLKLIFDSERKVILNNKGKLDSNE